MSSSRAPASTSIPQTLDTEPGRDLRQPRRRRRAVTGFLLNIIPDTMVSAFAEGEILQVLFVSILFGIALALVGDRGEPVLELAADDHRRSCSARRAS